MLLEESPVQSFLEDTFDLDVFGLVRVESAPVMRFKILAIHPAQMVVTRLFFSRVNGPVLLGNHFCEFRGLSLFFLFNRFKTWGQSLTSFAIGLGREKKLAGSLHREQLALLNTA